MIDINLIRNNPQLVQKAAKDKNVDVNVEHILEIDKKYKELSISVQNLRAERNKLTDCIKGKPTSEQIEKGKKLKEKLEKEECGLKTVEEELHEWLYKIPNLAKGDVRVGKDESDNEVLKRHGSPKKFSFKPKDHLELGESLDIIDVKRAAKVSGTRFTYLKNEGVLLEFALVQFALEILMNTKLEADFIPVIPPVLLKTDIMRDMGYMEHGMSEDVFAIPKDDLLLAGTAEHPIVAMHKDEVFNKIDLPMRYVGFSSAFRREAGSYGKDTRGILRVHQFDKVEMVSFVTEEYGDEEHQLFVTLEESFFSELDIPYQVVKMCTGDLGFPAARKYDIEAWIPSQGKYRELTSTSITTDFQARRLNIKYKDSARKNEKKFVHILNGTAFAIGRTIIAILENYQQEDGSVIVPKALQKYLNFSIINR